MLHLLALAAEADIDLAIEDFDDISRRTPKIVDLQPGGERVMNDLHEVGGVPVVLRRLLDAGLLHGDALTVTGRTMAEELAHLEDAATCRPTRPSRRTSSIRSRPPSTRRAR